VVDRHEARTLAEGNALSFLHVIRPEIDLPDEVDPYDAQTYAAGRAAFEDLISRGALVREAAPMLYAYRQQATLAGQRVSQVGIVGCCHVQDYLDGRIKKHEVTRQAKEDDRTRHVLTLRANTGPVFLTHRPRATIAELTQRATSGEPLFDFEAADGVRHTVWQVPAEDTDAVTRAYAELDAAYVADGHHRSASAARAGAELAQGNPDHTGNEEYNWFLCVLFAADQLHVLPYHRVVRDLGELDAAGLLERLRAVATVTDGDDSVPEHPGCFGMFLGDRWYRVQLPAAVIDPEDPVRSLDYVLLSEHVLGPILGIEDIRTNPRIDFVGGIRGTGELESRVRSGRDAVAFSMRATDVKQLMRVADAGRIMPPKSTWFEPKLRSGLLVHTLD
jgi:uncharacterized protein (DUF1015 family)